MLNGESKKNDKDESLYSSQKVTDEEIDKLLSQVRLNEKNAKPE